MRIESLSEMEENVTLLERITEHEILRKHPPEHGERDVPKSIANTSFGDNFNQSVGNVVLPSGLLSITFGGRFDPNTGGS